MNTRYVMTSSNNKELSIHTEQFKGIIRILIVAFFKALVARFSGESEDNCEIYGNDSL